MASLLGIFMDAHQCLEALKEQSRNASGDIYPILCELQKMNRFRRGYKGEIRWVSLTWDILFRPKRMFGKFEIGKIVRVFQYRHVR